MAEMVHFLEGVFFLFSGFSFFSGSGPRGRRWQVSFSLCSTWNLLYLLLILFGVSGVVMAGFVSGGRAWGGSIISRVGASGSVWSARVPGGGLGQVPASLCIPFGCLPSASSWARQVSARAGWPVVVRQARRSAGPFEVKVLLPLGMPAARARFALPLVP